MSGNSLYALTDIGFWVAGIVFIVAFIMSCYVPAALILKSLPLKSLNRTLLAFALGLFLWGLQGYVFGYAGWRWLSYVYVSVAFGAVIWQRQWFNRELRQVRQQLLELPKSVMAVLLLGSFFQLIQVVGSGLLYDKGLGFFRINAYDGMLHLSFISALVRQFPPIQPGAVGFPLTNYHYWSDLVMAEFVRVWQLPISHIFFQFIPVLLAVSTGLSLVAFVKHLGGKTKEMLFTLFFIYFAGDLAYVFTLVLHQTWGIQVAEIDNAVTQLLNMPHSMAKFMFLTGLVPLYEWWRSKDFRWGFISVILLASLFGFKVYFGIYAGIGLVSVGTLQVLASLFHHLKKGFSKTQLQKVWNEVWQWGVLGVLFLVLALAIFLPPNKNSGGLIWNPLVWPKLLLSSEHLNWQAWSLRSQVYEATHNVKGIIVLSAIAIIVCLLSVFGTRLIGLLLNKQLLKKLSPSLVVFLLTPCVIFIFLGLFTLQASGGLNVFNFFAVPAAVLSVLTAWQLSFVWNSRVKLLQVGVLVVLLLSLPRSVFHMYEALHQQQQLRFQEVLSPAELELLTAIREKTPSTAIIQSHFIDFKKNHYDEHTPYVSFITNRQTYLTGQKMLMTHTQPIGERRKQLRDLFETGNPTQFAQKMESMGIDLIYLQKNTDQNLGFDPHLYFTVVAENDFGIVFTLPATLSANY